MTLDPATAEIYRQKASDWRDARVGKPLGPAERLAAAASESLTSEVTSERWATVVDAVAFSPVLPTHRSMQRDVLLARRRP